jgi:pyridoxamine 5'-phosphate oxidase
MNKKEIIAFLNANPVCYLATVEGNAPRVRAMGIYKVTEEEIIIQTNITKDVNKQMLANPNIELLFYAPKEGTQIRVRGTVDPIKDEASLKKAMEDRPFLKEAAAQGNGPALFRMKKPMAYVWTMKTNYDPKKLVAL